MQAFKKGARHHLRDQLKQSLIGGCATSSFVRKRIRGSIAIKTSLSMFEFLENFLFPVLAGWAAENF
jgi:hypothetical protein